MYFVDDIQVTNLVIDNQIEINMSINCNVYCFFSMLEFP